MNNKAVVVIALGLSGALASAAAQAGNVQWSVSVATPGIHWQVAHPGAAIVVHAPYQPRHVYVAPATPRYGVRPVYYAPSRRDRDGDGIPNRRDRHFNHRAGHGGHGHAGHGHGYRARDDHQDQSDRGRRNRGDDGRQHRPGRG